MQFSLENRNKELEEENNNLLKYLGDTNWVLIIEGSSNALLEDKISLIQNN